MKNTRRARSVGHGRPPSDRTGIGGTRRTGDRDRPQAPIRSKIAPTATELQLDVTKEEDGRSASVKSRDVGEVDIVANNTGYFRIVRSMNWICRRGERR
jgi:hypothetical protein